MNFEFIKAGAYSPPLGWQPCTLFHCCRRWGHFPMLQRLRATSAKHMQAPVAAAPLAARRSADEVPAVAADIPAGAHIRAVLCRAVGRQRVLLCISQQRRMKRCAHTPHLDHKS